MRGFIYSCPDRFFGKFNGNYRAKISRLIILERQKSDIRRTLFWLLRRNGLDVCKKSHSQGAHILESS